MKVSYTNISFRLFTDDEKKILYNIGNPYKPVLNISQASEGCKHLWIGKPNYHEQ